MKYYAIQKSNTLTHHGIKGMRWGVRRFQDYDGHRIGSARRYKLSKSRRRLGSNAVNIPDLAKTIQIKDHGKEDSKIPWGALAQMGTTAISAGLLVARYGSTVLSNPLIAGVLAIDVASIVYQLGASVVANGKVKKIERERAENTNVDKKTGLKMKNEEMPIKEDVKRVNPGFKNLQDNTKNNCALCTVAYDLRRRGFDVSAEKATIGYTVSDVKRWYPKAEIKTLETRPKHDFDSDVGDRYMEEINKTIVKQGDGARGNLIVHWKRSYGGHSMAYEVRDGKMQVVDAQTGKIYKHDYDISYLLKNCDMVSYARLDNVEPDWKEIKECVKS